MEEVHMLQSQIRHATNKWLLLHRKIDCAAAQSQCLQPFSAITVT